MPGAALHVRVGVGVHDVAVAAADEAAAAAHINFLVEVGAQHAGRRAIVAVLPIVVAEAHLGIGGRVHLPAVHAAVGPRPVATDAADRVGPRAHYRVSVDAQAADGDLRLANKRRRSTHLHVGHDLVLGGYEASDAVRGLVGKDAHLGEIDRLGVQGGVAARHPLVLVLGVKEHLASANAPRSVRAILPFLCDCTFFRPHISLLHFSSSHLLFLVHFHLRLSLRLGLLRRRVVFRRSLYAIQRRPLHEVLQPPLGRDLGVSEPFLAR
mmetsp:Transcript_20621/g.52862  ORF Transcript_20621/g.52862 Transcript_20621/m.52862 type:complete len:267 (-) Transcript_20621:504-1304(-)